MITCDGYGGKAEAERGYALLTLPVKAPWRCNATLSFSVSHAHLVKLRSLSGTAHWALTSACIVNGILYWNIPRRPRASQIILDGRYKQKFQGWKLDPRNSCRGPNRCGMASVVYLLGKVQVCWRESEQIWCLGNKPRWLHDRTSHLVSPVLQ